MTGGVVVTVSQSVLTKRIANAMGLKIYETPIGFKYIADLMLKEDILIGAEESGGIGVKRPHSGTRRHFEFAAVSGSDRQRGQTTVGDAARICIASLVSFTLAGAICTCR